MAKNAASGEASSGTADLQKRVPCSYCSDTFASKKTKSRHEKNFHAEKLDYECPDCGKPFQSRSGLHSHHAQIHDGSITGYDRECPECGLEFTTSNHTKTYCSPECGKAAQRKRIKLTCETCDEQFETTPSQAEGKRFCSIECKTEWFSDWISGENHPNYIEGTTQTVSCSYCGEDTEKERHVLEKREHDRAFCSRKCVDKWRSENWVGENNPMFKGGDKYYGENWHRKRRESLIRDQYRCQDCGDTPIQLGRSPSVHHIIPIRDFKQPEDANTLDNLVTLCETCHSKWEGLYLRPDTR